MWYYNTVGQTRCRIHMQLPHQAATHVIQRTNVADPQHARRVDERVDVGERLRGRCHCRGTSKIEYDRAERRMIDRRCRDVEPGDPPALIEQRARNREPDARAAASDNGVLITQA